MSSYDVPGMSYPLVLDLRFVGKIMDHFSQDAGSGCAGRLFDAANADAEDAQQREMEPWMLEAMAQDEAREWWLDFVENWDGV